MRRGAAHRRILPIAALVLASAAWPGAAAADTVLVLFSTSQDAPMSIAGNTELPRVLSAGLGHELVYFAEYIDQGRFPDPAYQAALSDFLRVKYGGHRIDLIIAIQAAAVDFVNRRRDQLFPGTPVVFLVLEPTAHRVPNSTGVIAELDSSNTIALAVALQPEVRNVFVVSGAGVPDKGYERQTREQLRRFESRLAITYLSGLVTKDLEARLAALPEHSIVYYLVVYQDGAGQGYSPRSYLERVASVARAPTYAWIDSVLDRGIVGGSLLDRQAMMDAVGAIALRVLHGDQADTIPVSAPDLHVSQVDSRQLARWGISEARVPAGTRILFKESTLWSQYRAYIVGALAILLAQTALIAGLLINRTRRRQAEAQVRRNQVELQRGYVRIRDLGGRLLSAQDTERSRLARELHDDISQQMALLEIDVQLLANVVDGRPAQMAGEALDRVQGIARSVHDLSHRLHPARLRLIGLVAALQGLQRELSQPDMAITFSHENVPAALPPDLTLCLFRIVQEALHNAQKHSRAREVSMHLAGSASGLTLTVEDDGVGFDVDEAWDKGLGLLSMGERLEAIGGTIAICSKSGEGTRIEVKAPLRPARDGPAGRAGRVPTGADSA